MKKLDFHVHISSEITTLGYAKDDDKLRVKKRKAIDVLVKIVE